MFFIVLFLVIINIFVISSSLYFPKGKGYVKEFIESGTVEENCSNVNGKIENFRGGRKKALAPCL